jgi:hypothetical protein
MYHLVKCYVSVRYYYHSITITAATNINLSKVEGLPSNKTLTKDTFTGDWRSE